ncbi:MlaC/ttg2D family ABC transporter substrate-binding protein [Candidatus Spongiihabitans sp.]|uniref:MlaC/ttg2D family ABC transporter substrate-binding protein n=1 Tax=Candidatus Spongiihabitans sp. TaxID=3101308 RepID=UPI003C6ED5C2
MNKKHSFQIQHLLAVFAISLTLFATPQAHANDDPAIIVEKTVNALLEEFSKKRDQLEGNNRDLFELVNRIASPLFDFDYISKLVLAKSWKKANARQRQAFADEFKRLLIVTYATALFQYTGNETVEFGESDVKEKKGVRFGTVNTAVSIGEQGSIPVVYSLIQDNRRDDRHQWKIYNLTVGSLNMVLNYRAVIQSLIHREGLDGMIAGMKENNDKNY